MWPLQTVDSQDFRNFVTAVATGNMPMSNTRNDDHNAEDPEAVKCPYKVPHLTKMGGIIAAQYDRSDENLRETLERIDFVCTTADIWATRHKSYIGMSVHWLDPETFRRQSSTLSCERFPIPHNGHKSAQMIGKQHIRFGIGKKTVATITDNASSLIKAFQDFGIHLESFEGSGDILVDDDDDSDSNGDDFDATGLKFFDIEDQILRNVNAPFLPYHMRCISHTLNLLASSDFNEAIKNDPVHKTLFAKLNKLWTKSNFASSSEIIARYLQHALIRPNTTRWNSLFDGCTQIVENGQAINQAMVALDIDTITAQEFIYLNEYVSIFKPLSAAIDRLQATDCHFAILLPTINKLGIQLNEMSRQKFVYCQKAYIVLLERIQYRLWYFFEVLNMKFVAATNQQLKSRNAKFATLEQGDGEFVSKVALIATSIHPYFKTLWLPNSTKNQKMFIDLKEDIRAAAKSLYKKANPVDIDTSGKNYASARFGTTQLPAHDSRIESTPWHAMARIGTLQHASACHGIRFKH